MVVAAARYPAEETDSSISNYTRGIDYHQVLKSKLSKLAAAIAEKCGAASVGRICVDSAPLSEREWAVRAGLGWIGKQGSVVNPDIGCCFFLGELLLNIELAPSPEIRCQCQDCNLCMKACPMGAIMPGNMIDTRICIAYLTIEHKGTIDSAIAARMGKAVYGCDSCTRICPWNKRNAGRIMPEFNVPAHGIPPLEKLNQLDQAGFQAIFGQTPVGRIGFEQFQRNVKIALANQ